jgi:hypothetical protein
MKEYVDDFEQRMDRRKKSKHNYDRYKSDLAHIKRVASKVGSGVWAEAKKSARFYRESQKPKVKLARARGRLASARIEYQTHTVREKTRRLRSRARCH